MVSNDTSAAAALSQKILECSARCSASSELSAFELDGQDESAFTVGNDSFDPIIAQEFNSSALEVWLTKSVLAALSTIDCHESILGSESRTQALCVLRQLGSTAAQYPYAAPVLLRATLMASLFWGDRSRSSSSGSIGTQNGRQRKLLREAVDTADAAMLAILRANSALPSSSIATTLRAAATELLAQRSSCPDSAARRLARWAFSLTELSLPPRSSLKNAVERTSGSSTSSSISSYDTRTSGNNSGSSMSPNGHLYVRCSSASAWVEVGLLAVAWEERASSSDVFIGTPLLHQNHKGIGRNDHGILSTTSSCNGGGLRAWRLCDCVVVEVAAAIKRARITSEPSVARTALWRGLEACARQALGLDIRGSSRSNGIGLPRSTAGHQTKYRPLTVPASVQAWHLLLAHACTPHTGYPEVSAVAAAAPEMKQADNGEELEEPEGISEAEAMLRRLASLEVNATAAAATATRSNSTAINDSSTSNKSISNSDRQQQQQHQREQLHCVLWYLDFVSSFADPNHPALVRALRWLLNCAIALGPASHSEEKSEESDRTPANNSRNVPDLDSDDCRGSVKVRTSTDGYGSRRLTTIKGSGSGTGIMKRECPSVRRILLIAVEVAIQRRADRFARQRTTSRPQFATAIGHGHSSNNTGIHGSACVLECAACISPCISPRPPPPLPWLSAALSGARIPYEPSDDGVDCDGSSITQNCEKADEGDGNRGSAGSLSLAPLVGYHHLVQGLVPGRLPATAALLSSVHSAMAFCPPTPHMSANATHMRVSDSDHDDVFEDYITQQSRAAVPLKRLQYAGQDLGKLKLPEDCAVLVVQYLNPKRLCKLAVTSSLWHAAASRPALWKHHFYRRWGALPVQPNTTRRRGPQPTTKVDSAAFRPGTKRVNKIAASPEEDDEDASQHNWRALFMARAVAEKAIAGCTSNSGWRWRLCKHTGNCNAVLKSPNLRSRHAARHAREDAERAERMAKAAAKKEAKKGAKAVKE